MATGDMQRAPDKDSEHAIDLARVAGDIKAWGRALGASAIGVSDVDTSRATPRLQAWLEAGHHGEMDYMTRHARLRADPALLLPRAARVICARFDYLPRHARADRGMTNDAATSADTAWVEREWQRIGVGNAAVVSMYARGRDYHKVVRDRLRRLAQRIEAEIGVFGYRVVTDSAPVFEVEFARKAGLGWRGKHTLLLAQDAGSMFFLGEILTDLPLPVDAPTSEHCGTCERCLDVCPTRAIAAPYQLDARRCISYLTIEHKSAIPEDLRPLIGNRVYGCDDCQLACPWNKFARTAELPDFDVRNGLDSATLTDLFGWSEGEFRERHAGSAILRIGYERWLRNIAVGLGNAPSSGSVITALRARADHPSALVREHVAWALARHRSAPGQSIGATVEP